jgi:hypothetical protein
MVLVLDRRVKRNGVALLAVACLLTLAMAIGGMLLDLSRVLSVRTALEAQLESAALAAVLELDGTPEGLARARVQAGVQTRNQPPSGEGQSGLGASTVRCEFAAAGEGPWETNPARAENVRMVRVTGLTPVPLTLVRAMVRDNASNVWAKATAEQRAQTTFHEGLFPYSPIAPSSEGPHYGFTRGQQHTLRWAQRPSLETGNVCRADASEQMIGYALAERDQPVGWIEMTGRTHIRQAVLWGAQTYVRRVGDAIRGMGGMRALEVSALTERVAQDTDYSSRTYAEYAARGLGNGRRIVAAPLHSPHPSRRIVQIGAFFLLPAGDYALEGDAPFCAEYIGPYVQGSKRKGAADAGFHIAVLLR